MRLWPEIICQEPSAILRTSGISVRPLSAMDAASFLMASLSME